MKSLIVLLLLSQAPLTAREDRPELREKYLALTQDPPAPPAREMAVKALREGSQETRTFYLYAVIDRSVMISYDVAKENYHLLESIGAQHVAREEEIAHNTIYNGRYYRMIRLAENAPAEDVLQKSLGQPMKFDVAMMSDGRQAVLDVRRP
jgi:hypothetical protein